MQSRFSEQLKAGVTFREHLLVFILPCTPFWTSLVDISLTVLPVSHASLLWLAVRRRLEAAWKSTVNPEGPD